MVPSTRKEGDETLCMSFLSLKRQDYLLVEDAVGVHVGRLVHVDQHRLSPLVHSADHRHRRSSQGCSRKVIDSTHPDSLKFKPRNFPLWFTLQAILTKGRHSLSRT